MKELARLFKHQLSRKMIGELVDRLEHQTGKPENFFEQAVKDAEHDLMLLNNIAEIDRLKDKLAKAEQQRQIWKDLYKGKYR